jgi:triacylglycerol lipase
MTAQRLLISLAVELLIGFLAARIAGASAALAIPLAVIFVFVLDSLLILLSFAISWPRRSESIPARQPDLAELVTMIAEECAAYFALFAVIQPFETLFVRKPKPKAGQTPVLLVPGYLCNRGIWWWLARRLAEKGIVAEPVNLEPPFASIGDLADRLHEEIGARLQGSGSEKLVLVTHSMGGLAARAYLQRHGGDRVSKLITLACPHHGTRVARLGFGPNAREMEPGSEWLSQLPQTVNGVPAVNLWSVHDNFLAPQKSGRLEGAREYIFPKLGHLSFAFSRRVSEILARELA